ncbi:MAG: hypothetical protein WCC94_10335 [Candidatus Bathyarchaeia archaeon]
MSKSVHLSRVSIRRTVGETQYASDSTLSESLNTIQAAWGIPVAGYVRDLIEGRVDAVSLTKDEPYCYFFARRVTDFLSITIKDGEQVIEFSVPLRDAEKLLIA